MSESPDISRQVATNTADIANLTRDVQALTSAVNKLAGSLHTPLTTICAAVGTVMALIGPVAGFMLASYNAQRTEILAEMARLGEQAIRSQVADAASSEQRSMLARDTAYLRESLGREIQGLDDRLQREFLPGTRMAERATLDMARVKERLGME